MPEDAGNDTQVAVLRNLTATVGYLAANLESIQGSLEKTCQALDALNRNMELISATMKAGVTREVMGELTKAVRDGFGKFDMQFSQTIVRVVENTRALNELGGTLAVGFGDVREGLRALKAPPVMPRQEPVGSDTPKPRAFIQLPAPQSRPQAGSDIVRKAIADAAPGPVPSPAPAAQASSAPAPTPGPLVRPPALLVGPPKVEPKPPEPEKPKVAPPPPPAEKLEEPAASAKGGLLAKAHAVQAGPQTTLAGGQTPSAVKRRGRSRKA